MKRLWLLLLLMILVGRCATTRYGPAEEFVEKKQYDQAIRAYLKLLDPHIRKGKRYIFYDPEAITGIGAVYWYKQNYSTAIRVLQTVLDKEPSFGKARFYLGMCYESMGEDDEAIRVYRGFPSVSEYDHYRKTIVGRLDYLVRKKITNEVQAAIQSEAQLSLSAAPEKSVAVLYFLSVSEDPQWQPLQKGLAEMLITDLAQVPELKVIERLRLNKLMEEMNLNATGLMEEETSPRVGRLLGVRSIVKGSYLITPDLAMTIDTGIYQLDQVLHPTTANLEGDLARLFRMEKELVLRILDYFQIELTPQQRERILLIPTENMMAFINYSRGLDALDQGEYSAARDYFEQAFRMDPEFIQARDFLMSSNMWEAVHNRNVVRVDQEVTGLVRQLPQLGPGMTGPPALVSSWNRLQWMGAQQNTGFLPSTDSRESIVEAESRGAPVIPELLGEPPRPPVKE